MGISLCKDVFPQIKKQERAGIDISPVLKRTATIFRYEQLKLATNDFNPSNKLGQGGFGSVFKGTLADGTEIAVKKLNAAGEQGKREFINEIDLITCVQHRNLMKLIGCCAEGGDRLLVFEYLAQGSLDKILFGGSHRRKIELPWVTRRSVILGVARGLAYLHEESQIRIIHRDIKASNILLDKDLSPKIADFGMARLFSNFETHISTNQVAGTLGYVAPEYAMHGELTEKADVFSFGLVCLEIVSGRKNTDNRQPQGQEHLLEWAWGLFQEGKHAGLVDPRLQGDFSEDEVIRVIHVALLCTQGPAGSRPTMSRVIQLLSGRSQILDRPIMPIFVGHHGSSSSRPTSGSRSTLAKENDRSRQSSSSSSSLSSNSSKAPPSSSTRALSSSTATRTSILSPWEASTARIDEIMPV